MASFVLVHGSFRGGWSFALVAERLEAAGHRVYAPTLSGCGDAGEESATPIAAIGLDTWVQDVVRVFQGNDLQATILVGHSMGAVVVRAALERVASRVARAIYLDGPIPRDGEAAADALPATIRARFAPAARGEARPPIPVSAANGFPPELAAWVNARLTPTPVAPSFSTLTLRSPEAAEVPRTVVFSTGATEMHPSFHERRRFDSEGSPYDLVDAPHDFILTHPDLAAALLLRETERR